MKLYKNDIHLNETTLADFYYDKELGVIRKKSSGKIMRAKSVTGVKVLVANKIFLNQRRVVAWMNGLEFTPSCEIEHIDGDISNVAVENLRVVPYVEPTEVVVESKFSVPATNDKYLAQFAELFQYDPESGHIYGSHNRPIKPCTTKGYVRLIRDIGGRMVQVAGHRLAMFIMGHDLTGLEVDHIDGDRGNNRYSNLRLVTRSINRRNTKVGRNNTSGISGVNRDNLNRTWQVKGFKKTVGYSKDFFEACCIRKSWENKVGGYTDRHGV